MPSAGKAALFVPNWPSLVVLWVHQRPAVLSKDRNRHNEVRVKSSLSDEESSSRNKDGDVRDVAW
jgi:hypothetical protein